MRHSEDTVYPRNMSLSRRSSAAAVSHNRWVDNAVTVKAAPQRRLRVALTPMSPPLALVLVACAATRVLADQRPCPSWQGWVRDGGRCQDCPGGSVCAEPFTGCKQCRVGTIRRPIQPTCTPCPENSVTAANNTRCDDCGLMWRPDWDRTACRWNVDAIGRACVVLAAVLGVCAGCLMGCRPVPVPETRKG